MDLSHRAPLLHRARYPYGAPPPIEVGRASDGIEIPYPSNAATTTSTGIDPIVVMSTVSRAMISPRL